jgi:hypothetical protein
MTTLVIPAEANQRRSLANQRRSLANQRRSLANQRRSLAGIQEKQVILDPGFRRGDGFNDFLRSHQT